MKAQIKAGAEIDFVSPKELRDEIRSALQDWQLELSRGVKLRRVTASTVAGAGAGNWQLGGDVSSDEFGPRQGFFWSVLRFSVLGNFAATDFARIYLNSVTPSTFVTDIQIPAGGSLTSIERDWAPGQAMLLPDDKFIATGTANANSQLTINFTAVQIPIQLLTRLYLS